MDFNPNYINSTLLRERAYNLRWAEVEEGVIPLTSADLDFPCAPQIVEAIKSYANPRYLNYGPPAGLPMLKEAVSDFFYKKRNVTIAPKNILPVNSAAFGIYTVCKAFLQKGDEAIVFDPVDFLFNYSIESVGAIAVPFSIPPSYDEIDFSSLEMLITNKTKLICLCNPINPTGKVFTKKELISLANIANKYGILILSDEIWSDIVFPPHTFTSIASLNEEINNNTIIVTGFSKSYGIAGLRIGAILTNNDQLYAQIFKASLHQSTVNGVSVLSQVAATTALNDCELWLSEFLEHLQKMRTLSVNTINKIPGFSCIPPQGTYVAFIEIKNTGLTSKEMHALLLKKAKVAVVPGLKEWFGEGAEGYIRCSFATSAEILTEAFDRISKCVSTLHLMEETCTSL